MDLQISEKSAIVCASSKGLGKACAKALANEGVKVWICGRHQDSLDQAVAAISAAGGTVQAVKADITTDEGRKALLSACPEPDILVNNAGGPDEFGAVCAFLCSQQAAYITAQNILMDGGLYPGTK